MYIPDPTEWIDLKLWTQGSVVALWIFFSKRRKVWRVLSGRKQVLLPRVAAWMLSLVDSGLTMFLIQLRDSESATMTLENTNIITNVYLKHVRSIDQRQNCQSIQTRSFSQGQRNSFQSVCTTKFNSFVLRICFILRHWCVSTDFMKFK